MSAADPFRIRDHVAAFDEIIADYGASSRRTRAALPARLDVACGEGGRGRLDLFLPPPNGARRSPIHLFVHGGYWRSFTKEDYSFVADAVTSFGAIAAIMDYGVMPGVRMATLVAEVRAAAAWLRAHADGLGGAPECLSASGHSAGGHLVSFLALQAPGEADFEPAVRSVLALSGLFDLAPVGRSFLQAEIRLTPDEIATWTPLRARPVPGVRWDIAVGAGETPPFQDQAAAMIRHLAQAGLAPAQAMLPGEDHMTIVRSLGRPGSETAGRLGACIAASLDR